MSVGRHNEYFTQFWPGWIHCRCDPLKIYSPAIHGLFQAIYGWKVIWVNVNWFKVTIFALKRTKNDLGERKRTIIERKSMLVKVASIAGATRWKKLRPAADHVWNVAAYYWHLPRGRSRLKRGSLLLTSAPGSSENQWPDMLDPLPLKNTLAATTACVKSGSSETW